MAWPIVAGRIALAGSKAYRAYRKAKLIKRAKAFKRAKKVGKGLLVADTASEVGTGLKGSAGPVKKRRK